MGGAGAVKPRHHAYQQFIQWVQEDLNQHRLMVNRKVFSVVFWCLVLPSLLSLVVYGLYKFQILGEGRTYSALVFTPPFLYALYSIWPTLREVPRVFKKGGFGATLEESIKEVEWKEQVVQRLSQEVRLSLLEWAAVEFHLKNEIHRLSVQNRHLTLLSGVVLFFMFQFLDLGSVPETINGAGPSALVRSWVDQASQWGGQVVSLLLFSTLFYLSGTQIHRYLERYLVCVQRLNERLSEQAPEDLPL
jgi:hypothetical protein